MTVVNKLVNSTCLICGLNFGMLSHTTSLNMTISLIGVRSLSNIGEVSTSYMVSDSDRYAKDS
jgi:HD-like signal output (HDOD) protein